MELIHCRHHDMEHYISFCRSVYRSNIFFRDSSLTGVLRLMGSRRDPYFQRAEIAPLLIQDRGAIVAACILMVIPECPDILQFTYFEAREGCQPAVDMLMAAARQRCAERGLRRILVGVDSTVGILTDNFDSVPCYGTRLNPAYYPWYFNSYGGREHLLTSYLLNLQHCRLERESRILERIRGRFTCRSANWRRLEKEANIYTGLKNRCFAGQPFFNGSSSELNYRMFCSYQSLIFGQNLLILEHEGAPVGYLLWFPDYNQLLAPGESLGPDLCRKHRLLGHTIKKFIVSEIAVLPEFQGTGAVLALFDRCLQLTGSQYEWCETGWILNSNLKSRGFGLRWAGGEHKHYKVYEIEA